MRICMILEGCYPYVRGGVSAWMHGYIQAMPQHDFVLWVIGAESKNKGLFKYELPANVVEVHEVFLDDALNMPMEKFQHTKFSSEEIDSHKKLFACENPDWWVLFRMYNVKKTSIFSFLMSEEFLKFMITLCKEKYPYVSFAELFHTLRSMILPSLYLMRQEIPEADIYHATSTGYGGLLGVMASCIKKRPFIVTEHGIYTREREEELLRAKWVKPYFKHHWINLFYMLANCAYDNAQNVTSLFHRAKEIQEELGCDPIKQRVIGNGIHYKPFSNIPDKIPDGFIDIAAIVRIHPIKDIKTMIYAFFEVKSRVPNVRLHILGDTDDEEYRDECVDLVQKLGVKDLMFVGNTNVVKYLEKIDFTILTSISEGQPLSVLESMAAKRPCITTDVGCCRELIEGIEIDKLGRAGVCVPPMHSQAIANAIELLCKREDLRFEMGEIGRQRVLNNYLHSMMIENYTNNYKEVLEQWQALDLN